ncbi:Tubulin-specific chaperone A [Lamellibrachia satsuma]|nr:Tubulin-specific chaperone A [Lamellibrachia satsuma]
MADVDPKRVRAIKIKTGIVKRLAKEKVSYEKEIVKQKERIEKMKAAGDDEYDIRKQGEVLEESVMMIPDTKRRLAAAWDELSKLMETEEDLKEIEEYTTAMEILEQARADADR